jgi:tRNA dimethylallyltransferase
MPTAAPQPADSGGPARGDTASPHPCGSPAAAGPPTEDDHQMTPARPKIVVVCGPTGTGKTSGAIELARRLGGEIVGADSMQVYRHMDIGTAKPTAEEQAAVPHHLIDMADPDQQYDAARYTRDAGIAIHRLHRKGKAALVVGGTGFYIRALVWGVLDAPPSDPQIRLQLQETLRQEGASALFQRLRACDPATADRLHPHDTYRVIRALEVFAVAGRPLEDFYRQHRDAERPYEVMTFGLHREREALYERINRRVDRMMAAGFVEEVRGLLDRGYGPELRSMQALGYRHVAAWLGRQCNRAEAIDTMKRDTRRYAKRQLTWFRPLEGIEWIPPERLPDQDEKIRRWIDTPSARLL